jgi:protein SCO1
VKTELLVASLVLATVAGCAFDDGSDALRGDRAGASAMTAGDPLHPHPPILSDYSLYDLDSEWWDQDGRTRTLASLGGRVQVLSMVYTNCGHSCPRILGEMKRLEADVDDLGFERIGFVLASLDAERDTPERLRGFAEDLWLDTERWTLLGAEAPQILELAAVLGIRYRKESETEYSHTNLIVVLSPDGQVAHRMGIGEGREEALAVIRALLE